MSDKSRNRTFWAGSKANGNATRAQSKQSQEELNCRMGRERIAKRYAELKARGNHEQAGGGAGAATQ